MFSTVVLTFLFQMQLITSKGYQAQEHTVQTSDGYQLRIQRIPCAKAETTTCGNPREAVLLQHGLLASSSSWLINAENESLGKIIFISINLFFIKFIIKLNLLLADEDKRRTYD